MYMYMYMDMYMYTYTIVWIQVLHIATLEWCINQPPTLWCPVAEDAYWAQSCSHVSSHSSHLDQLAVFCREESKDLQQQQPERLQPYPMN